MILNISTGSNQHDKYQKNIIHLGLGLPSLNLCHSKMISPERGLTIY